MTDQLTIGQSLTPEQVRNLPDGAKAMMRHFRGEDVEWINSPWFQSASQIADMMESGMFIGAVLVSLPSEPSPGEGYRWLVPKVDTIAIDDELDIGEGYWLSARSAIGEVCNVAHSLRRRIEPQAEPAPRVASEIEKEAARSHLHLAVSALISECSATYDRHRVGEYGKLYTHRDVGTLLIRASEVAVAESYAKSIGAIE